MQNVSRYTTSMTLFLNILLNSVFPVFLACNDQVFFRHYKVSSILIQDHLVLETPRPTQHQNCKLLWYNTNCSLPAPKCFLPCLKATSFPHSARSTLLSSRQPFEQFLNRSLFFTFSHLKYMTKYLQLVSINYLFTYCYYGKSSARSHLTAATSFFASILRRYRT